MIKIYKVKNMKSTLYHLANIALEKIIYEMKVEFKRDNESIVPQKIGSANKFIAKQRSQIFSSMRDVKPKIGSLLAVGLGFGFVEHTGIYVDDDYVIEQHSDCGLKKVTLQEFRDGDGELYARGLNIGVQIACDSAGKPLAKKKVAKHALELYEDYRRKTKEYSLVFNNCHQFCWECIAPKSSEKLVMFTTLEEHIAKHYGYVLYWDKVKI